MRTSILLLSLTAAAFAQISDTFGYTARPDAFSYSDISASGIALLANTDDASATLNLPFGFRFYGATQSLLCVSTNGLISFGTCISSDFTNVDISSFSPTPDNPLIAPLWQDLNFNNGNAIYYQTLGSAPNRKFIVQWQNPNILNTPGSLNFQVELRETTNEIVFRYLNVEVADTQFSKGAKATVGIRNAQPLSTRFLLQWSYNSPVISNASAILFAPPASTSATNVTSSTRWTATGFTYNRITLRYTTTLTLTNIGTSAIARPLSLVLANLPAGVTAVNPVGLFNGVSPYFLAPGSGPLAPGQTTSLVLEFNNPNNVTIRFDLSAYSGNL